MERDANAPLNSRVFFRFSFINLAHLIKIRLRVTQTLTLFAVFDLGEDRFDGESRMKERDDPIGRRVAARLLAFLQRLHVRVVRYVDKIELSQRDVHRRQSCDQ